MPDPSRTGPAPRAWLSWSSGKDSTFALQQVRRSRTYEVVGLLTTLSSEFGRVSIHGVREDLLDRQARAVGLPLAKVWIPDPCPNEVYEREMTRVLERAKHDGVRHVIFGDLFLEEIRRYRESRLSAIGMKAAFPLWGRDTAELAQAMIAEGLRARIACLDTKKLPSSMVGGEFDARFLGSIPAGVDPCGERGEFHTFVTDARVFRQPVNVLVGEVAERRGYAYADLRPG